MLDIFPPTDGGSNNERWQEMLVFWRAGEKHCQKRIDETCDGQKDRAKEIAHAGMQTLKELLMTFYPEYASKIRNFSIEF